jgi:phosphate transport system permease protein
MKIINKMSFAQRMKNYKKHPVSLVLYILVLLAAVVTMFILLSLIGYILIKGIPQLRPSLFAWHYSSENNSMMPAIINTVIMTAISLVISVPLGYSRPFI